MNGFINGKEPLNSKLIIFGQDALYKKVISSMKKIDTEKELEGER